MCHFKMKQQQENIFKRFYLAWRYFAEFDIMRVIILKLKKNFECRFN